MLFSLPACYAFIIHELWDQLSSSAHRDSNNVSDPYVVLRIGPHSNKKRSTEIQYSTVNAVWEKKFLFDDLRLTPAQLETEKVWISSLPLFSSLSLPM